MAKAKRQAVKQLVAEAEKLAAGTSGYQSAARFRDQLRETEEKLAGAEKQRQEAVHRYKTADGGRIAAEASCAAMREALEKFADQSYWNVRGHRVKYYEWRCNLTDPMELATDGLAVTHDAPFSVSPW